MRCSSKLQLEGPARVRERSLPGTKKIPAKAGLHEAKKITVFDGDSFLGFFQCVVAPQPLMLGEYAPSQNQSGRNVVCVF
jgi:hypothetical protein